MIGSLKDGRDVQHTTKIMGNVNIATSAEWADAVSTFLFLSS